MVGSMAEKSVWIFITLFPVFVSITQFSDFWVMSYGNWKNILGVFNFHNSVFNSILVIKHTWKDPLVRVSRNFWPFFFFLLHCTSVVLSYFLFFLPFRSCQFVLTFYFYFGSSSHNIFGLRLVLSFFFFFFSSSFTGLHWLVFFPPFFFHWVRVSGFFFFFSLGSVSLGTGSWRKKEKKNKKCTKLQVWGLQIVENFD